MHVREGRLIRIAQVFDCVQDIASRCPGHECMARQGSHGQMLPSRCILWLFNVKEHIKNQQVSLCGQTASNKWPHSACVMHSVKLLFDYIFVCCLGLQ